jgi:hypothetical protein
MALEANIVAKLKVGTDTYDISLNIPSGTPTPAAPYAFNVTQEGATPAENVKLLDVLIGDATHFHVAIAPPQSVLSLTGAVEDLTIQVDENYDETTGKFITSGS